jgi:nucleotide-binding universal stress UspA family protein
MAATVRTPTQAVHILTAVGEPASTITAVAEETCAQVIALATHGRSGLARVVLGSVAARTLQGATVPVLMVRPRAMLLDAVLATNGVAI